jgi:hypothetical protein
MGDDAFGDNGGPVEAQELPLLVMPICRFRAEI